jgi:probable rRNA maturation factor
MARQRASRGPGAGRVELVMLNRAGGRLPRRGRLRAAAELALAGFGGRSPLLATLAFVGGREMAALNARFHGRRGATDVLSFPLGELDEDTGRCLAGEVVVCRPVAVREARRRGLTADGELLLYAVHGWLHLAGHDDRREGDRRRMQAAERRILGRLGFSRDGERSCPAL